MSDWLTEQEVLDCHAQFGRLDRDKVKAGMGPNWPAHWERFGPGEAIWEPERHDAVA